MFCQGDKSSFGCDRQPDKKGSDLAEILFKVLKIPNRRSEAFFGSVNSANYNFNYIRRKLSFRLRFARQTDTHDGEV
jgi:hypothetical protein